MFADRSRRSFARIARIECLEERIVLSGQAAADFWLDDAIDQVANDASASWMQAMLADAHAQSGLNAVRSQYGLSGQGQTAAIIDSGIAWDHEGLGGGFGDGFRVVGGWDFSEENDADPYDDGPMGSHGTHVAGIIGADVAGNSGVAPGMDLVALRVFNDAGAGYFDWVESALEWVHENRNSFENPITTVNISLGTVDNADTIPNWATLEDELAQLEADGIFVAVAAGNSFTSFGTPGLSYPASSEHVVPVMATGPDGNLSYFSQRHERAIAAPGQSITSTVPDYVGNLNGVTDDFATYSGTSMASPYLAGASAIVRDAMQLVGQTDITQDDIYTVMVDSADTIFDAETSQNYNRLNLQAAIESIMPEDDFGSTVADAYQLDGIEDTATLTGMVGQLDDVDYFSFTADALGTITLDWETTDWLSAEWELVGAEFEATEEGGLTFDVAAGQTYTFGISTTGGLGHFTLNMDFDPTLVFTDWGVVDFAQWDGMDNGSGESWYRVEATRNGLLTIEALFAQHGGDIDMELYNDRFDRLASSGSTTNNERLDWDATAGDTFYVRVTGENASIDFRVANLVAQDGSTVRVAGTRGDDTFSAIAGPQHEVTINGVEYLFDGAEVRRIEFDGGSGGDTATLVGTEGNDLAVLRPGQAEMSAPDYTLVAAGVETVFVHAGGGTGYDLARFYDSAGDDRLVATPSETKFWGDGFSHRVFGFDKNVAYATAGGFDQARFYDSAGNDRLVATPDDIRFRGDGFNHRAFGFERNLVHATAGGFDDARFYDSAGDDRLVATPDDIRFWGDGFLYRAFGFDKNIAHATAGGFDYARFYDSAGDDRLIATPDDIRFWGDGFLHRAFGFDKNIAYATAGGFDYARFYDSAGDDRLIATPDDTRFWGDGYLHRAFGFDKSVAYATAGGFDHAKIYDSQGDGQLIARSTDTLLRGADFVCRAFGYDAVYAYAKAGETDMVRFSNSADADLTTGHTDDNR